MGMIKYLKNNFRKGQKDKHSVQKERMIGYRKEPATVKVDNPTRLDRARALGYKAKQGIFVVRQRVKRGSHVRARHIKGRNSRNQGMRKNVSKSYQAIAEERVAKKYVNCEILNSYFVAKDGIQYWYEVIVVDKDHPSILKDKDLKWVADTQHTRRVFRGKTSAQRKSRGLRKKGQGTEKYRPSKSAAYRKKVRKQSN